MRNNAFQIIKYSTMLILGTYFLFYGLHQAGPFLIPFSIAVLLSMVMLPVSNKLQRWGFSRGLAVLASDLIILAFCSFIIFVVGLQVSQIADDWPQYEKKIQPKIEQAEQFISRETGIGIDELKEKIDKTKDQAGSKNLKPGTISSFIQKFFSFAGDFLLVFIYIFFLMYYSRKFRNSILGFVPEQEREKAKKIIDAAGRVSQQYLFGRFILILILTVLYAVGLGIVGIKQAILVSLIAAILSLIPYIGNMVGYGIALLMGMLTSGGTGAIIGVSIVFAVAQFVESYILEPFIVGERVDLNPTLTIIGVVALGMVWGLAGMVMAIPVMGILKVISDNVPALQPLGYTLGNEDISTESNRTGKFRDWIRKKKK